MAEIGYEVRLLVERERRRILAQKFSDWEAVNGIMLMPMKIDPKKGRIEQLVDGALFMNAIRKER
jgi:hypothetical protein